MRLESKIIIHCPPEEVWKFLGDLQNIAKWDRGVASAAQTSAGQTGVGSRFDTLARGGEPETGRMSYRISETGNDRCVIELDGFEGSQGSLSDLGTGVPGGHFEGGDDGGVDVAEVGECLHGLDPDIE